MKKILIGIWDVIFIIAMLFCICINVYSLATRKERQEQETRFKMVLMERSYYEGQKDAIAGDVRIKFNEDSSFVWTKSPWNNGAKAIFDSELRDKIDGVVVVPPSTFKWETAFNKNDSTDNTNLFKFTK